MAHSPCFYLPLLIPLCLPLCSLLDSPLLTWNPPSCDRIRPPRSQVACKLTSPDPTLSPPSPFQIPRTPDTPRLTKTTSGTTRHLLSGTNTTAASLLPQSDDWLPAISHWQWVPHEYEEAAFFAFCFWNRFFAIIGRGLFNSSKVFQAATQKGNS